METINPEEEEEAAEPEMVLVIGDDPEEPNGAPSTPGSRPDDEPVVQIGKVDDDASVRSVAARCDLCRLSQ